MAVNTCWHRMMLSDMTLASNRALTLNFSEVEAQYRTLITSQNTPLEPFLKCAESFSKTLVLRPPSSCSNQV